MGDKGNYDKYTHTTRSIIDKTDALLATASSTMARSQSRGRGRRRAAAAQPKAAPPPPDDEYGHGEFYSDNVEGTASGNYGPFFRPNSRLSPWKEEHEHEEHEAHHTANTQGTHRRPRTTDGITTGFSNMHQQDDGFPPSDTRRRQQQGRAIRTAEGIRTVEFNHSTPSATTNAEGTSPTAYIPHAENKSMKRAASTSSVIRRNVSFDGKQHARPASSGFGLPTGWNNKRVNEEAPSDHTNDLTKHEWENEVARHILSLYATSKADKQEDINKSKSIISFVDNKRPDSATLVTLKNDVFLNNALKPEETDKEYLREISLSNSTRVRTATGGSRDGSRAGSRGVSSFTDFVAEEGFGFINPSRPGTTNRTELQSRSKSPFVEQGTSRGNTAATTFSEFDDKQQTLPAIHTSPGRPQATGNERTPKSHMKSPPGKPSTPKVSPIWFVSSGDVYVDWSILPGGQKLQLRLNGLYEQGKLKEYVSVLEFIIGDLWSTHSSRVELLAAATMSRQSSMFSSIDSQTRRNTTANGGARLELSVDQLKGLWKQLITAANAMGILAVEKKKFVDAHDLLHLAEHWCKRKDLLTLRERKELRAHVVDSLAYYFYRRQKVSSALTYTEESLEIYESLGNNDCIAICLLHIAAMHCVQGNFKESHRNLYQFIAMVEDGSLAFEAATPQQLCLVAVCYHNLAVVQLKLDVAQLACKSSQNARKLARLCLSFSNRWIDTFQRTHEIALDQFKRLITSTGQHQEEYQRFSMDELADSLMR